MRIIKLTLILFVLTFQLYAQVNTERMRKEISEEGLYGDLSAALSLKSGNSEYYSVKGDFRIDYLINSNDFFIVTNYEFKEGNNKKIVNKGFAHLRGVIELSKLLDLEIFTQKEFNEFILLKDRTLFGSGLRYNLSGGDFSPLKLFIGSGLMYEKEVYNLQQNNISSELLRSTSYLTANWKLNDKAALILIFYAQPALKNISDIRLLTDSSMRFTLSKSLAFFTTLNYRYDSEPVGNLKKFDLEITNGINFSF
jgi:putative salt-induced outer membrane protein YdiY